MGRRTEHRSAIGTLVNLMSLTEGSTTILLTGSNRSVIDRNFIVARAGPVRSCVGGVESLGHGHQTLASPVPGQSSGTCPRASASVAAASPFARFTLETRSASPVDQHLFVFTHAHDELEGAGRAAPHLRSADLRDARILDIRPPVRRMQVLDRERNHVDAAAMASSLSWRMRRQCDSTSRDC